MKITWIVPHFPPHVGGGEKLYYDVCTSLVKRGCRVRVITGSSGGIKGHRKIKGVDVWYCDWPMFFGHPLVRLSDIIRHVKWCDVVHTTVYTTAIKSNLAAAFCHKKCVTTVHEVMGDKWFWFEKNSVKALAFRIYERLIISLCPYVHVVSSATAVDFIKYEGRCKKLFRIYNFLHLPAVSEIEKEEIGFRRIFSLRENEKGILYFGRPAKNKGIFVLLEAVRFLDKKMQLEGRARFCLILADEPSDVRKQVTDFIRENRLSPLVTIIPSLPRKELLKVISGADLCVIPSVTEGFGYSAAEACELGRPVIASDGGSLPEVIHGSCMFFKNRDSRDLARKLSHYIKNGTKGFTRVPRRSFERDRIVDEYMEMYRSVCEGK